MRSQQALSQALRLISSAPGLAVSDSCSCPSHSAESTLAERFAQDDIDEKDYRARLELLRATAWPQPHVK